MKNNIKEFKAFIEGVCKGDQDHDVWITYCMPDVNKPEEDYLSIEPNSHNTHDAAETVMIKDIVDSCYLEDFITRHIDESLLDRDEDGVYAIRTFNSPVDIVARFCTGFYGSNATTLFGARSWMAQEHLYIASYAKHFSKYCPIAAEGILGIAKQAARDWEKVGYVVGEWDDIDVAILLSKYEFEYDADTDSYICDEEGMQEFLNQHVKLGVYVD